MCLSYIFKDRAAIKLNSTITAYKVFTVKYGRLLPLYMGGGSLDKFWASDGLEKPAFRLEYYKVNKWYKNPVVRTIEAEFHGYQYHAGYHAFKDIEDAKYSSYFLDSTRVYEVVLRKITACGVQGNSACYVAQEMKINRRIK